MENAKSRERQVWKNCVKQQIANPLKYFYPKSLDEIIDIVKDAERNNYKVKAVGSGHSFSDVALTRDYLIDTHGLCNVLDLSCLSLKVEKQKGLTDGETFFLTECGITIHQLNDVLESENKALINMGGFTGQTIIGAISTSTHGSGVTLDSLSNVVEAIILVGEGGKLYHVEPSDGVSNKAIDLPGKSIELIQEDDVFYSSVVSIGCMGVIYAVLLRVTKKYYLEESREFCNWSEVKKDLTRGNVLTTNRHCEVLINPYRVKKSTDLSCLVTKRNKFSGPVPHSWGRRNRNWTYTILGWFIPCSVIHAFMKFLFNHFPTWTPMLLEKALKSLSDNDYVDKSFKVLDLGIANYVSAYSMEIAFPSNTYIDAIEAIITIAEKSAKDGLQFLTSPISLRFVKTSKHYLSMQYGENSGDFVCMVEFPIVTGTTGGHEMLSRLESAMLEFKGIPHWGQVNHVGVGKAALKNLYPKLETWLETYRRFNKKGMFENDFSYRCGITH